MELGAIEWKVFSSPEDAALRILVADAPATPSSASVLVPPTVFTFIESKL